MKLNDKVAKLFYIVTVTPCTSSPCLNNGECKVQNDTYQCECPVGFNGTECQGKYV